MLLLSYDKFWSSRLLNFFYVFLKKKLFVYYWLVVFRAGGFVQICRVSVDFFWCLAFLSSVFGVPDFAQLFVLMVLYLSSGSSVVFFFF